MNPLDPEEIKQRATEYNNIMLAAAQPYEAKIKALEADLAIEKTLSISRFHDWLTAKAETRQLEDENEALVEALEKIVAGRFHFKDHGMMDFHKIAEQALKGGSHE